MLRRAVSRMARADLFVAIHNKQQRSFFWSKKEKAQPEENNEEEKSWQNISYLIEKMKEDNKRRPRLLPPKSAEDKDKLTVVVEMDEVLVYIFAPDEHEAYMSQPMT